jgi:hypothetical protein
MSAVAASATTFTPSGPVARATLGFVGLAAMGGAVAIIGPWTFALWLVPDVALLFGWSRELNAQGRLAPRAVPLYNALHALLGPVALLAASTVLGPAALGAGLLWLSHVTVDRATGYGLRTRDGRQRG